jgi:hypothetical protein
MREKGQDALNQPRTQRRMLKVGPGLIKITNREAPSLWTASHAADLRENEPCPEGLLSPGTDLRKHPSIDWTLHFEEST